MEYRCQTWKRSLSPPAACTAMRVTICQNTWKVLVKRMGSSRVLITCQRISWLSMFDPIHSSNFILLADPKRTKKIHRPEHYSASTGCPSNDRNSSSNVPSKALNVSNENKFTLRFLRGITPALTK